MSATPKRTDDAQRDAITWEAPSLVELDVGGSEKTVVLPTEYTTHYYNVNQGPAS